MNLGSLALPKGAVLLKDMDDERSMATAFQLGLYSHIVAGLKSTDKPSGMAGIQRSGDWLVAVFAWERCVTGNGWAMLSISPVSEENLSFLKNLVRIILDERPEYISTP
ncbi:MAG: hypothetical protein NTV93_15985 [Verrucomicrobia bacterium]|jgi:hypothetical protein|nr:hypothetical protein [Verrucomicrobiota bacterium]